jgi:hypothetical protein
VSQDTHEESIAGRGSNIVAGGAAAIGADMDRVVGIAAVCRCSGAEAAAAVAVAGGGCCCDCSDGGGGGGGGDAIGRCV